MIEVVEVAVMMTAMLVVVMKVMMIVKIKDKDGGSKFDCVDDVYACDSINDDGVGEGSFNINVDGDAGKDGGNKNDIGFEVDDGEFLCKSIW